MADYRWFLPRASALALVLILVPDLGSLAGQARAQAPPSAPDEPKPGDAPAPNDRVAYDPELVNKTVAFWKARAERDPQGALELRELAGAYLARQRETGDIDDAVKAEDAARRSLKILRRNNSSAMMKLARALLAQHRFPEALEEARRAAAYDPQAHRLIADIQMELGDYEAARRALADSPSGPDDPNALALRARLEEIDGRPEEALRLLRDGQRLADGRPDMPAEAVAWYHAMIGHALIDSGRLDEGDRECRLALKVFPRDYRAMTGLAESATWRGDWKAAIAWGDKVIEVAPQNPEALKLIGDAHAALGHDKEAERHYQLLKDLAHSFPRIYDRHWALFCADNGRDLDEALALARKDLELRRDVHAYDALAWVCFKKQMLPEAEAAMKTALARGTREAPLLYHAGMIARASGDAARARDYLTRALAINPHCLPPDLLRWVESKDT